MAKLRIGVIGLLAISAWAGPARADTTVFILRAEGERLVVEPRAIPEGGELTFVQGQDGFIDVILPVGPGGSGSIIQPAMGLTTIVSAKGGAISARTTLASGKTYDRPAATIAELRGRDIHVSAHGPGVPACVFIRGYERIEPDRVGVIEDPFGGTVPLGPADCVIYTNTFEARKPGPGVTGRAGVEFDGQHHRVGVSLNGGVEVSGIVDLAAGATIISRAALPDGVGIDAAYQVQYTPDGVKRLATEIGGATGAASPLGIARLPKLRIGGIEFDSVEVIVMPELPTPRHGPIGAIIGIDLLSRASSVTLPYPQRSGGSGELVLGGPALAGPVLEIPLSLVAQAAYCAGLVNGREVRFIVDTGSGMTILDDRAASSASIEPDGEEISIGGASGAKKTIRRARAGSLTLGGREFHDEPLGIASLPIFQKLRGAHDAGILGNEFFARFRGLQLDFDAAVLRLAE